MSWAIKDRQKTQLVPEKQARAGGPVQADLNNITFNGKMEYSDYKKCLVKNICTFETGK
jgi:hypothetical protein